MIISDPQVVFDPYDWLPTYGESKVGIDYNDMLLTIKIFYELKGIEYSRKIEFEKPAFFHFASNPGVEVLNFKYEKSTYLTCLLEYTKSDVAEKWSQYVQRNNYYRHYLMNFHKANKRLDVVATSVKLLDE